jgi:nitrogenase molybdenum-iron protein alpha chain
MRRPLPCVKSHSITAIKNSSIGWKGDRRGDGRRGKSQADVRPRLEGKLAMMFVGGSRAHHYQELFNEMGIKTIAAGYEFAHRDDYEGRSVLPTIKVDADSRNIEELEVKKIQNVQSANCRRELAAGVRNGIELKAYDGMMADMEENVTYALTISASLKPKELIEIYKPDIFCAGYQGKVHGAKAWHPHETAA